MQKFCICEAEGGRHVKTCDSTGSQESGPLIRQALQGIYANIPFGQLRHSPPTPKSGQEAQKVSKQFSRHAFNSASPPRVFFYNVSNYCGTLGIQIHLQRIPPQLLARHMGSISALVREC